MLGRLVEASSVRGARCRGSSDERRAAGGVTVSATGIYALAGAAVVTFLIAVQLISSVGKRPTFLKTVILGKDGRTSTSKTFILMWTLLVAWALIALLIAGSLHQHACVAGGAKACKAASNEVGLLQVGWKHFLHEGLSGSYLVLLGVPAAAGVAAKGITQNAVSDSGFKAENTKAKTNLFERTAEIFSADDGTTDIGDFQYMVFNLVTAVYFVVQFVRPDGTGLPTIPDTLLGLTSVSAGLYVGKKAVTRTKPVVTAVFPQPIQTNGHFTVVGERLTQEPTSPTEAQPQVTIDGIPVLNVAESGSSLTAVLPDSLGGGGAPKLRHLQVKNPYDGVSDSFDVQCQ
jgi:hypothetical protein